METNPIINEYRGPTEEPQLEHETLKKLGLSSETANGCFDCNICLDFAVDPVVTLCGHLYCWPCIYKWLQVEPVSPQQCPVCKASLSHDALVPLYGRGRKRSHPSFGVPQRPNSCVVHNRDQSDGEDSPHPQTPVSRNRYSSDYVSSLPSSPTSRVIHSTAGGVLGGMAIAVLPWVLRNHQEAVTAMQFSSPSPYYLAASSGSPRLRRQEMEVESSLRQIWLFLFCCAMLCLLLF